MITTATEIKYVENSFEELKVIELDLEGILVEQYAQGLPNDIDCTA